MTLHIAAYDVESQACLEACRRIVSVHRRRSLPATFFVLGKLLEQEPSACRELFDDPLFEVASHSYSHGMLRDHPFCGPALPPERAEQEIRRGKHCVEQVFERECLGLRPGCSFVDGLRGAADVLAVVADAGFQYVSSQAWGPDYSMPAPLNQPFNYAEDGFPELWELPCHGWHENLLKDHNRWGPRRLTLWPPSMPEAIPARFVATPEEEFNVNRVFLDRAAADGLAFVSLIWHPWSLARFDPETKMLHLTFEHARHLGLEPATYRDLLARVRARGENAPATEARDE